MALSNRPRHAAAKWRAASMALLTAGAVWVSGRAAPSVGAPRPHYGHVGMQAAQATPAPPTGTWRTLHGPSRAALWATNAPRLTGLHLVDTPAGLLGYAVGSAGALARYQDGTWQKLDDLDPKKTSPLAYDLNDVFVVAPDDVWVVAAVTGDRQCGTYQCGALLHYDGQRWAAIDRTSYGIPGRVPPMRAIDMQQDGSGEWFGWIVGDDLTTDTLKALIMRYKGGRWRVWTGPNNFARHLQDVKLVSPGEAWLVGLFGIESWYTERENGVGDWAALGKSGADDLYAVDMADPLYGWDGGNGGRMNRYQGHCHDDDPGTQCWFDNQARPVRDGRGTAMSQDVTDIDLLSRTVGWLVGAASARRSLVAWLDGEAQAWNAVNVDGDQGTTLYGLQMVDARRGFAVGDKGTIIQYVDDTLPTATTSPTDVPPTVSPVPSATATVTPMAPTPGTTNTGTATDTARPTRTPSATTAPPTSPATFTPLPTASHTVTPTVTSTVTPASFKLHLPFAHKPRRRN